MKLYLCLILFQILDITNSNRSLGCGLRKRRFKRVIGGRDSDITDWPWVAAILTDGKVHCTGSLISEEYVLSAAHCFSNLTKRYQVRLGSSNSQKGGKVFEVNLITYHEEFNFKSVVIGHDIAVLKLEEIVKFSPYIFPICLTRMYHVPAHGVATVTGFGKTENGNNNMLKEAMIVLGNVQRCSRAFNRSNKQLILNTNDYYCGGMKGHGVAKGDSGAPLVVEQSNVHYQIGIVSVRTSLTNPERKDIFPDGYIKVGKFCDWIEINTKKKVQCISPSKSLIYSK